jgi:general nucleoside transport system ATP-binding protein
MIELRNITKRFGAVKANDDVSLTIRAGTIHAIVGENGAGKSTLMKIAYGFYRPDSGEILINGERASLATPQDAIARGVGMVHQHFMLVDTMTVAENIVLGAEPGSGAALDLDQASDEIAKLSREYGLAVDPKRLVRDLSVGEQQRVEILKALYRRAKILILDEPTAVLTPQEIDDLFRTLRGMRDQGETVVIITHKLSEVLALSDRVSVMRDGRVVGEVDTKSTSAADLARMMVGRDVLLRVDKSEAKQGNAMLEVRDLRLVRDGRERLRGLSFDVRAGEIVGIAGVEGNGQSELIEALAGLADRSKLEGSVRLGGREIAFLSARQRKDLGIAHVPEDRHRRGLLLDFSLAENSVLGFQHHETVSRAGMLDRRKIGERTEKIIRDFDVRPPNAALPSRALSGGNQQKLILGREFALDPVLLLVSQPTRGVDIGAIEFIHRRIVELRDRGCAILLVSAELEEVTQLSDRLLVMHAGEIAGEVDPRTASREEIGLLMTGGRKSA